MKKIHTILFTLALTAALCACTAPGGDAGDGPAGDGSGGETPANVSSRESLPTLEQVYRAALDGVVKDRVLPDEEEPIYQEAEDLDWITFSVMDIDRDGLRELILQVQCGPTAGHRTVIYSCDPDTGTLYRQFTEFPTMDFYSNGIIVANASHNQGLAPENFWPYTMYQYIPEEDSYFAIATADAWEKRFFPANRNGDPFPDDIDQDGDGIVYFLVCGDEFDPEVPIDGPEYREWWHSMLLDSVPVDLLSLKPLTQENIDDALL